MGATGIGQVFEAGYHGTAPYDVVVVDVEPGLRVTGRLAPDSALARVNPPVQRVGNDGDSLIFTVSS